MHIECRGLIRDALAQPDSGKIAFFDGLCRQQSGTVLSGYTVGPAKHAPSSSIRLSRTHVSRLVGNAVSEGGKAASGVWDELPHRFETTLAGVPGSLAGAELVEAEPGRLLLATTWFDRSDPDRPLFDPVTEGILRSRLLVAESTDKGTTWSDWTAVPTQGLTGCALTGPWLRWPDGTLALAFESFKEYDDPNPARHAAWLAISTDGGRRFGRLFCVARHPKHTIYYWDQRLCVMGERGQFAGLFWTHDLAAKRDLAVHFLRGSIADGDTASALPAPTPIPGQIAAPLLLDDGGLLAFVVDRSRPGTMALWRSNDGGATWPAGERLVVHVHDEQARLATSADNVDFKQYWEDMGKWSFGHPAICRLDADRVLVSYYAGTPDRMSVHWTVVRL